MHVAALSTFVVLGLSASAIAHAQPIEKPPEPPVVTGWSLDQLDPHGLTRFHATSRAIFKNGSAWSFEGRAQIRLADGLALFATLPVAVISRFGGALGNIAVGMSYVGGVGADEQIHIGGGLDVYTPTGGDSDTLRKGTVAALRAYEPMLYIPKLFSFRARGYFDVQFDSVRASMEIGLVPAFSLEDDGGFLLLLSASGRISAALGKTFEPYLEVASTPKIAGIGQVKPPLLITPGIRLHIAEVFDPALFVSFNFVEASAVIFGLDLAAAIRPASQKEKRRESFDDDFLGDDF